ncbi:MAG: agmatine deiminase, partial [Gammaproteobacteria bacterium]
SRLESPADSGFYMPAEWTPHSCTWMAWPCRDGMWKNEPATRQAYANVANAIAQFEPVKMLASPRHVNGARDHLDEGVEVVEMEIDDSWTRDTGPNFLVNKSGDVAGSCWKFNAWGGNYQPYDQDALMGERILAHEKLRVFSSELIAEGGGITVDGEGTIITTESCFPHSNRNPGWSREKIEHELCRTLGAEKVIWIPGDVAEIETNGHIDGIAAFVKPGVVLVEIGADEDDPYYATGELNTAALHGQTDAKGRPLRLEFICTSSYANVESDKDCRSYVNSYLANGAVIVPAYNSERDVQAVETYARLYPQREIVQVEILAIAEGGGAIHCITQQQPEPTITA